MKIVFLPTVAMLFLAGCATTGPTHTNYKAPDAACIKGDTANFIKFFYDGEAHVQIKEIDGVPTGNDSPYCFAPGKHTLGVSAYNNHQTAQDYIDIEFIAGKKYWLRANLRGISFVFQLIDITNGQKTKVNEFKLKVGSINQPAIIPIIIPVR